MSDELEELKEHAEHAAHDPSMAPISLTMAILAVLVAVATLLGHRAHTEEVVLQNKASDQWAYYQAKDIRLHADRQFADLEALIPVTDSAKAAAARQANQAEAEKYSQQVKDIQDKARDLEKESDLERRRADRFDLAEVCLEIGLVITSITLLSGRRVFWHAGIVFALTGVVVACTSVLVH
jgi:Domain of unknown function (DUF4337)